VDLPRGFELALSSSLPSATRRETLPPVCSSHAFGRAGKASSLPGRLAAAPRRRATCQGASFRVPGREAPLVWMSSSGRSRLRGGHCAPLRGLALSRSAPRFVEDGTLTPRGARCTLKVTMSFSSSVVDSTKRRDQSARRLLRSWSPPRPWCEGQLRRRRAPVPAAEGVDLVSRGEHPQGDISATRCGASEDLGWFPCRL
jgi:hypothetical protein